MTCRIITKEAMAKIMNFKQFKARNTRISSTLFKCLKGIVENQARMALFCTVPLKIIYLDGWQYFVQSL